MVAGLVASIRRRSVRARALRRRRRRRGARRGRARRDRPRLAVARRQGARDGLTGASSTGGVVGAAILLEERFPGGSWAASAAAAIAAGVLWSNALAYANVWLAPRSQLAELETIGKTFAGDGPTLDDRVPALRRAALPAQPRSRRAPPSGVPGPCCFRPGGELDKGPQPTSTRSSLARFSSTARSSCAPHPSRAGRRRCTSRSGRGPTTRSGSGPRPGRRSSSTSRWGRRSSRTVSRPAAT